MADITNAYPDRAHEALRTELLAAINAGQQNTAGVDDSYFLTDVLFDLIDSLLSQVDALNVRADAAEIRANTAQADIDALQQRVAQLEDPPPAP